MLQCGCFLLEALLSSSTLHYVSKSYEHTFLSPARKSIAIHPIQGESGLPTTHYILLILSFNVITASNAQKISRLIVLSTKRTQNIFLPNFTTIVHQKPPLHDQHLRQRKACPLFLKNYIYVIQIEIVREALVVLAQLRGANKVPQRQRILNSGSPNQLPSRHSWCTV